MFIFSALAFIAASVMILLVFWKKPFLFCGAITAASLIILAAILLPHIGLYLAYDIGGGISPYSIIVFVSSFIILVELFTTTIFTLSGAGRWIIFRKDPSIVSLSKKQTIAGFVGLILVAFFFVAINVAIASSGWGVGGLRIPEPTQY
jgi:hypothetical protein